MNQVSENVKHVADVISVTTVVGTLTAWLPPIAAALSIVWTSLRIYEMLSGKSLTLRRESWHDTKKTL